MLYDLDRLEELAAELTAELDSADWVADQVPGYYLWAREGGDVVLVDPRYTDPVETARGFRLLVFSDPPETLETITLNKATPETFDRVLEVATQVGTLADRVRVAATG
jgi:hypothetical protein